MSILKDLEHELLAADARVELQGLVEAAAPTRRQRPASLRRRWRRLGRRGRVTGVFAGALMLSAVATGSAQIAGLDPWGKLVGQDRIDPQLRPTSQRDESIGVRVADAPGRPGWELRAYVTRSGDLCVVGAGRGGEGLYRCFASDRAAAVLAGRRRSGPPLVGVVQTGVPSMRPTRLVGWALTPWDAPPPAFGTPRGSAVDLHQVDQPLRVAVNHSPEGLSNRGRALLKRLPDELTLRLTVVELVRTRPTFTGDMIAVPSSTPAGQRDATVEITSAADWQRVHGQPWVTSYDDTLDRSAVPVRGATASQRKAFPALARPRQPGDAIPSSALTMDLRGSRVALGASRRLRLTGEGSLGPAWLVPGAIRQEITVPTIDGLVCIAGPLPISGCTPSTPQGELPEPTAVICAPDLPKGQSVVWAFVPARAERARVSFSDGSSREYPSGDLLALVRPRSAARPTSVEWSGPGGFSRTVRVRFPRDADRAICGRGAAPRYWQLETSGEEHR